MIKKNHKTDFTRPFVLFRSPGETPVHFWQSESGAELCTVEQLAGKDRGWVTAPFLFFEEKQLWYFPADVTETFAPDELPSLPAHAEGLPVMELPEDTSQADFEAWVASAVGEMQQNRFQKTALSKTRRVSLPEKYDWRTWFETACARFPNALVFFVHIPGVHTWAGATPELFLSVDGNHVRSVSLAGTLHPDSAENWSEKELHEQALVTEYIRDTFLRSGFADVAVKGPETLSIGRLRHLKTSFEATRSPGNDDPAALTLRLHPTPAVGGMPKKEGTDFIRSHETHERLWYSGFLGRVAPGGESDWYVNLRCMRLGRGEALLYAGAGITAGSVPREEWRETENKLGMNLELLR